jgi:hypothetical protein
LRRLKKVNTEALLIASGQNVKRLLAFGGRGPKKLTQAAALRPPAATGYKISRFREHCAERSWPPGGRFSTSWNVPTASVRLFVGYPSGKARKGEGC